MRRSTLLFAGLALLASSVFGGEGTIRRNARRVPGRYIVVLQPGADTAAVANTVRDLHGARVRHTYERGIKGFGIESSDADARVLAADARVQFVEEDSTVSAAATTWGLDRIDQRFLPLNGSYVSGGTGAGVSVYVVDTGILPSHVDFGGRVAPGFNAISDNTGSTDCNGHGTHVAGVIGGAAFGVAKSATLVPVRVLDCSGVGSVSTLLAGLEWILQDHAQSATPAVVNMSLGGEPSSALDSEVELLINAGLPTVVAAGNSNADACSTSPARVSRALTVGATTEADQRAPFSNYGACVDIFAPGSSILSDWYTSPSATAITSGTSSAAPFVSGVAALCLEKYPTASASTVTQTVLWQSTLDALGAIGDGSPNRLLFSSIGAIDETAMTDSQILSDPGFDYGTTFWTSDICTVVNPTGCPPTEVDEYFMQSLPSHSGHTHAAIGGPTKSGYLISEAVTVPSTVRSADLTFYLWIVSKNKRSFADDTLRIEIRDAAGTVLETLGTFSNLDTCPDYIRRRFDVSRYRGATIRISFTMMQDNGPPTWFVLDDVGLNVRR